MSSYPFILVILSYVRNSYEPILLFIPLFSIRSVEAILEVFVFNHFEVLTSSSSLHTGALSLFYAIFSNVGFFEWAHNPQVFPGSCLALVIIRRSLILFNYDVSMIFISHIQSSRSIGVNSHIWLDLAFFFIPEVSAILGVVPRHHS